MYYTYIIQSESLGIIYIGQTNDVDARLARHNGNRNIYTKNKGPWKLLFYKTFDTRAEAVQLEKKLKSIKNKAVILDWISRQDSGSEHPDL